MHCDLDAYFQGHTISGNDNIYLICVKRKSLRKTIKHVFIEVDISCRIANVVHRDLDQYFQGTKLLGIINI